jgi:hypothetical protein
MSLDVVLNPLGDELIWTRNGSGVALGVWAQLAENPPQKSTSITVAHNEQKAFFTKPSENKDEDTSRLNAHGSLSSSTTPGENLKNSLAPGTQKKRHFTQNKRVTASKHMSKAL